jgi:hypothetical protein
MSKVFVLLTSRLYSLYNVWVKKGLLLLWAFSVRIYWTHIVPNLVHHELSLGYTILLCNLSDPTILAGTCLLVTWYQSGFFSWIDMENGYHCLRNPFLFFQYYLPSFKAAPFSLVHVKAIVSMYLCAGFFPLIGHHNDYIYLPHFGIPSPKLADDDSHSLVYCGRFPSFSLKTPCVRPAKNCWKFCHASEIAQTKSDWHTCQLTTYMSCKAATLHEACQKPLFIPNSFTLRILH